MMKRKRLLKIGGKAGTGKSSLIKEAVRRFRSTWPEIPILLVVPTWKAGNVLKEKFPGLLEPVTTYGITYGKPSDDLSRMVRNQQFSEYLDTNNLYFNKLQPVRKNPVIILIDEASMVGAKMLKNLMHVNEGAYITLIGDDGQLLPVKDKPVFLRRDLDFQLSKVFRQAQDNPILRAANAVRDTKADPIRLAINRGVPAFSGALKDIPEGMNIAYINADRSTINRHFNAPMKIRENRELIVNQTRVQDDGVMISSDPITVRLLHREQFEGIYAAKVTYQGASKNDFVDITDTYSRKIKRTVADFNTIYHEYKPVSVAFPTAITCHKAQGSEAAHVNIFPSNRWYGDALRRLTYTALTRSTDTANFVILKN